MGEAGVLLSRSCLNYYCCRYYYYCYYCYSESLQNRFIVTVLSTTGALPMRRFRQKSQGGALLSRSCLNYDYCRTTTTTTTTTTTLNLYKIGSYLLCSLRQVRSLRGGLVNLGEAGALLSRSCLNCYYCRYHYYYS